MRAGGAPNRPRYAHCVPQRADAFDLGALGLSSGEGRRLDLHVKLDAFDLGGERYEVSPALIPVRLDVSRTMHSGWALRLRFEVELQGPCMRCLEPARRASSVDAARSTSPAAARS